MKKNYHFSHDNNASQDEKILNMRADFGWEGYGIYWAIIERLRDSNDYKYCIGSIKGLAVSLGIKFVVINKIINEYGLFQNDGDYFWSNSLIERMRLMEDKSIQAKFAGKRSGELRNQQKPVNRNLTDVQRPFNDRSTSDQNQLNGNSTDDEQIKENKNKIKEKELTTTTTTTREIVFEIFQKKIPAGYDYKIEAEKFISMNEAYDWLTRGGLQILPNIEKFTDVWIARLTDHKQINNVKINGNGNGNGSRGINGNQKDWGAIYAGACDSVDEFFDKAERLASGAG